MWFLSRWVLIKRRRSSQQTTWVQQYYRLERRCDRQWYDQCWRLISSGSNTIWFLWRRELIKHRHSPQHCLHVESYQSACFCWKSTVIWWVPTTQQFLPEHHMISMEEGIARSLALSTTLCARCIESIGLFLKIDNNMWIVSNLAPFLVLITIGFQCSINWHENRNCTRHCRCSMYWRDPTMKQFLPETHVVSMEESIAALLDLCTARCSSDGLVMHVWILKF
jgi:hypothetical protein